MKRVQIECDEKLGGPPVRLYVVPHAGGENEILGCPHYAGIAKCSANPAIDSYCRFVHAEKKELRAYRA
jgi:hypothetical protein